MKLVCPQFLCLQGVLARESYRQGRARLDIPTARQHRAVLRFQTSLLQIRLTEG